MYIRKATRTYKNKTYTHYLQFRHWGRGGALEH